MTVRVVDLLNGDWFTHSEKPETLRVYYNCRCHVFGCKWEIVAIRGAIEWLAAGGIPNSLYRVPLSYLFPACPFFEVFIFVFRFHSLVGVPLIFSCSADHASGWQPHNILLFWVWLRPDRLMVKVKNTHTHRTCCMYVFIELHITAQSGPAILVILCYSH